MSEKSNIMEKIFLVPEGLMLRIQQGFAHAGIYINPEKEKYDRPYSATLADVEKLMTEQTGPSNFHVFKATYLPVTAKLPSRVRIRSERFKQSVIVGCNEDRFDQCRDVSDIAAITLRERGFNVVGIGEGSGCMYVFSDTFKPLTGK